MNLFGRIFRRRQQLGVRGSAATETSSAGRLPVVTKDYLHRRFAERGTNAGLPQEAVTAWNGGDFDRAFELLYAALESGLSGPASSGAYSCLGEIHIRRKELLPAVECFLKCLKIADRDAGACWQCAMRLYYIYSEIGESSSAASLLSIAQHANKIVNWKHAPDVEREVRLLARSFTSATKGEESPSETVDRLLLATSAGDDAVEEVIYRAAEGDAKALSDVERAVELLAGRKVSFYRLQSVNVMSGSDLDANTIRKRLLDKAGKGKLLADVEETQADMMRLLHNSSSSDYFAVCREVQARGGWVAGKALQLLDTHMKVQAHLQRAEKRI